MAADEQWISKRGVMVFRDKEDLEDRRRWKTEKAHEKQESGERVNLGDVRRQIMAADQEVAEYRERQKLEEQRDQWAEQAKADRAAEKKGIFSRFFRDNDQERDR